MIYIYIYIYIYKNRIYLYLQTCISTYITRFQQNIIIGASLGDRHEKNSHGTIKLYGLVGEWVKTFPIAHIHRPKLDFVCCQFLGDVTVEYFYKCQRYF